MAKKEKKEKVVKEKKPSNPAVKAMVTRCVAAALCTVFACCTAAKCVSDYAEVIKNTPAGVVSTGTVVSGGNNTESTDVVGEVEDTTDPTGEETTESAEETGEETTEAAGEDTTAEAGKPAGGNTDSKPTASPTAQAIEKYNTAVNKVKSGAKSVKLNYEKNSQVTKPEINNKLLASAANTLINANMGVKKQNVVFTSAADKKANFTVKDENWSSKLTEADVKSATSKSANGVTTVTIQLIDDKTPNIKQGGGHVGKAFSIVTKDKIVEGAGSLGMRFIKEESIKLTYGNCKIVAKIDDKTGNLTAVNYYQEWKMALSTNVGVDVAIAFGLEEDFSIGW